MKATYWKPQGRSSLMMMLAAVLAAGVLSAVELFPTEPGAAALAEKQNAAHLANQAFQTVKAERLARGVKIDPAVDPAESGIIGLLISPVTSNHGHLPAKQATANPNFAAVAVEMLKKAGVKEGDVVAVGLSGSFPALNICVHTALKTLKARPLVVSSASASQWGANLPELLWIDMENLLHQRGLIATRSLAASLGGVDDQAVGMSENSLGLLRTAIERNNLPLIEPKDLTDSINQRMLLYHEHAAGKPIKAYINVGGGATSVGPHEGKKQFDPGLNLKAPLGQKLEDSVMSRFAKAGVPVLHFTQTEELAMQYGLPVQMTAAVPRVGEGEIYSAQDYNPWLAGGGLALICLVLSGPRVANGVASLSSRARQPSAVPAGARGKNTLPKNSHPAPYA